MAELSQSYGCRREVPDGYRIQCVYLTCFQSNYSFLADVLQYSAIRVHRAETVEEADFLLTVTGSTVLLSDITFPDGSWRDALLMAGEMHPRVASLLIADPADWPFLSDAYDRGACGVLPRPIDYTQALRLIRSAHQAARDRASVLDDSPVESLLTVGPTSRRR